MVNMTHPLHDDFLKLSNEICLLLKLKDIKAASAATRAFIEMSKELRESEKQWLTECSGPAPTANKGISGSQTGVADATN